LVKNLTSDAFAAAALAKIVDSKTFTDPAYYGAQVVSSSKFRTVVDEERQINTNPGYRLHILKTNA